MISDAHAESEKPEQNLYCKGDLQQDIQQPTAISTIRLMRSPAHTIEWTVDYITETRRKSLRSSWSSFSISSSMDFSQIKSTSLKTKKLSLWVWPFSMFHSLGT